MLAKSKSKRRPVVDNKINSSPAVARGIDDASSADDAVGGMGKKMTGAKAELQEEMGGSGLLQTTESTPVTMSVESPPLEELGRLSLLIEPCLQMYRQESLLS